MASEPLSHTVYPLAILLLPLGAFVTQITVGRRLARRGDWVSTGAMVLATVLALLTAVDVLSHGDPHYRIETAVPWVSFGQVSLTMGFLIDNLTAIMLLLVTAISLCVHIFSIFYMHGDKGYHRYFAFLSLFCFSMLGIVVADNLLMTFMFWELVGFSSYALIGFWFEKAAA
ncbi:MAG: NADH-quinone oxidoreductase subunit L, partial [bacterium]|nr:NADH-quinone oxidoreductase subunit L [bacterium]